MKKFIDHLRKTTKTNVLEQKVVQPLVGSELDNKYGYRSIGYQDLNGVDPVPPEYKSVQTLNDGSYDFGDIIDGINEPKLSTEALGTITGTRDNEDSNLSLVLQVNGIYQDDFSPLDSSTWWGAISTIGAYEICELGSYPFCPISNNTWVFSSIEDAISAVTAFYNYGYDSWTWQIYNQETTLPEIDENDRTWEYGTTAYYFWANGTASGDVPGWSDNNSFYLFSMTTAEQPEEWTLTDIRIPSGELTTGEFLSYSDIDFSALNSRMPEITGTQVLELARNIGTYQWIANPNFPGVIPAKYSSSVSVLSIKFGVNRNGIIEPTVTNGVMLYEVDGDGDPIGYARIYTNKRILDKIIPAEQVFTMRP